MGELKQTPLHALHAELGARMTGFAGYDMPLQYPPGVLKEHLHCRAAAGLFDVSHMGQILVTPKTGKIDDAALRLEGLVPAAVAGLAEGRQRYGLFTNDAGGILDDLMFANRGDHLYLVVNAACKDADLAHLQAHLGSLCDVVPVTDRALIALQGPSAEAALAVHAPGVAAMRFMDVTVADSAFGPLWISRSGYSGEDGFEISVAEAQADAFARALLDHPDVAPIGLGARDSLRLEAGLCLYGADLDTSTSPIEADLGWSIQKARRAGGAREGGFPGAARILRELEEGPARMRVGLRPDGRAPMRAGTPLFASADGTDQVGTVTSGAFGPSIEAPMSMAYVSSAHAAAGTALFGEVRGKRLPATIVPLPFRPATYKR
ncbi:MAG: glycine cleavage system aminomethyltransferase GcvT [Rhodobacteraceae bacterium]|nr:glycine cleavage system aminomethyltransferase GcvT [Paracoccaceae bacterium]